MAELYDTFLEGYDKKKLIPVHACVMSSVSPVLHKLLLTDERRSDPTDQVIVQLETMSTEIIELVVKYIYTGTLQVEYDQLKSLIGAAKLLQINSLQTLCENANVEEHNEGTNAQSTYDQIAIDPDQLEIVECIVKTEDGVEIEGSVYFNQSGEQVSAEENPQGVGEEQLDTIIEEVVQAEEAIVLDEDTLVVKTEESPQVKLERKRKNLATLESEILTAAIKPGPVGSRGPAPSSFRRRYRKEVCMYCNKRFEKYCHLLVHLAAHTDVFAYSCDVCGKRFKYKNSIRLHMKRHGSRSYECMTCGKKFFTPNDLSQHQSIHTGSKQHTCGVCSKSFRKRSDYRWHMLKDHEIRTPGVDFNAFTCKLCDQGFQLQCELNTHMRYIHAEKYACDFCEAKFRLLRDMKSHVSTEHSDLVPKTFNCPQCGKTFSKPWKADLHQRTVHHLGTPMPCTFEGCQFVAYRAFDLKDHQRRHLTSKRLQKRVERAQSKEQQRKEVKCKSKSKNQDNEVNEGGTDNENIEAVEMILKKETSDSFEPIKIHQNPRIICEVCGIPFTKNAFVKHYAKCKECIA